MYLKRKKNRAWVQFDDKGGILRVIFGGVAKPTASVEKKSLHEKEGSSRTRVYCRVVGFIPHLQGSLSPTSL